MPDTTRPSGLILRANAAQVGLSLSEIRRRTARKELVRLRRGGYLDAVAFKALQDVERHAEHIRAALAAQRDGGVVSHISAAVLLGLPVWAVDLGAVHLTKPRRNSGRRSGCLHVHTAPLEDGDTVGADGLMLTSPARTVLDLACSLPFEQAVVLADAALSQHLVSPAGLSEVLERSRGRHGRAQAQLVIGFADGRSQSVGESRSRVGMSRAGVPKPGLQREIFRSDGTLVGRSDFDWDRLLGEFDGFFKYGRLVKPGETAADVVIREKLREDELRDLGNDVVRWCWAELSTGDQLYPRILRRIEQSSRRSR